MAENTLDLIDRRIRKALVGINLARQAEHQESVRIDVDEPAAGLMIRERMYYRFRVGDRFQPLLVVRVTHKTGVYYLDVEGAAYDSDVYNATKRPTERTGNDSFFLADELDVPLDAIEEHMVKVLGPKANEDNRGGPR